MLITVEYQVDPADAERFVPGDGGARPHTPPRRRLPLGPVRGPRAPGCYLETFVVDSWSEHLRQHDRLTVADLELTKLTRSFHRGEGPPKVRHLLWARATLEA